MEDQEIERMASSLGGAAAERLDVERVAAEVLARLRADRARALQPRRAWWTTPLVLRLAAAVVVLTAGGLVARRILENPAPPAAALPAPMLRELTSDELVEVFDSLGVEAPVHEGLAVGLESLNEAQLKELLSLMEG